MNDQNGLTRKTEEQEENDMQKISVKHRSYYKITTGGLHGENVILSPRVVCIRDVNTARDAKDAVERLFRKWYGRRSTVISSQTISGSPIVTAYDDCRGDWLRVEPIWSMIAHSLIFQYKGDVFIRRKIRLCPGLSGFSSWQTMLRRSLR